MKRFLITAVLMTFVFSGAAFARWQTLPGVGLKVDIPKAWKVESEGEVTMTMPATEDLMMVFWEFGGADSMEAAMKELDREIERFIKDPEVVGEPDLTKLNGLDAVLIDGKGKAEGQTIEWSLGLVDNGKGKILLLMGFAEPEAVKQHGKHIQGILKSIKKK